MKSDDTEVVPPIGDDKERRSQNYHQLRKFSALAGALLVRGHEHIEALARTKGDLL
jgi:hypothetical protein